MSAEPIPLEAASRILLIEDSEVDRLWLRRKLDLAGVELIEVSDGLAGMEVCRNQPPDLILLDLNLLFYDGFEILKLLKDDLQTKSVPVIVISSSSQSKLKENALDLGASDFVTKPYDIVELRARIRFSLRNKRHQDMLEHRAHIDGLTGLANRLALQDRLITEWALYERYEHPLAVLIVDLDHFKRVNDIYGHVIGDEVLKRAAALLKSTIRTTDLASRFGGEEFVVVAPYCDLSGAEKTAERYRQRLAGTPFMIGDVCLSLTASVGFAAVPEDGAKSHVELLNRADQALYEAKASGRNLVRSSRIHADIQSSDPMFRS